MTKTRSITLGEVPAPFEVKYHKVNEVIQYGDDNAYPTRMERITNASITAKSSADMMARFLSGKGFVDTALNDIVIGKDQFFRPVTTYKLLSQIAASLAKFQGFWVRAQFDLNYNVTGLKHEPFRYCRFGELDDNDMAGKVIVYNNWDKYRSRSRFAKEDKKKFKHIDIWNPDEKVIKAQVERDGGIKNYKGQMYFNFLNDEYIYPEARIDPVKWDADTEAQIGQFKNGELRRGFFLKYIIQHAPFENERSKQEFEDNIKKMMGGGHEISHLLIEGEFDEETGSLKENGLIKVDKIEQNINNKLFDTYEQSCINNIRKAFNAIPQSLVDYEDSQLGTTSGEAIRQAAEFYNSQTQHERDVIQDAFTEMFRTFKDKTLQNRDWTIEPLTFDTNVTTVVNNGSTGNQTGQ